MKIIKKALAAVMLITVVLSLVGCNNNSKKNPEFVDLGLPSGTLWATFNVGASKPESYGDYFAWGETKPKANYSWDTYKYYDYDSYHARFIPVKYCDDDNLTTLQDGDDPATANWGSGWRTPSVAQWEELKTNTTCTITTLNGVQGWLFTASNGNSLFLPTASFRRGKTLEISKSGSYWSSSLSTSGYAWYFYFGSDGYGIDDGPDCSFGRSVRAVRTNVNTKNKNSNTSSTYAQIQKIYSNSNKGFVNIHQSPQSNAPILGVLRNGPEGAILLGTEGEWKKIDYNSIVGYVYEMYVQDSPTEVYVQKIYSNSNDGFINIHQFPQSNAPILGILRNGPEGALLLGKEGEWKKIDCNGLVGYVYEMYVQDSPTEVYEYEYWGVLRKDASVYQFTENDLYSLTTKELTYLSNSVYARHGYVFKSQELNNYFKQFGWYHPDANVTDAVLNDVERANVEFIKNYQERNSKTYKPTNGNDNKVVIIDGSELRLRLGPSTSSDTFKWPDGTNRHPKVGERFMYLGESGDFYKIDFNGYELWVSKQFTHIE